MCENLQSVRDDKLRYQQLLFLASKAKSMSSGDLLTLFPLQYFRNDCHFSVIRAKSPRK